MENLSKESLEYVEFMIDMFCDGFEGDGEVRFNINRDEYGDSDLYSGGDGSSEKCNIFLDEMKVLGKVYNEKWKCNFKYMVGGKGDCGKDFGDNVDIYLGVIGWDFGEM